LTKKNLADDEALFYKKAIARAIQERERLKKQKKPLKRGKNA